MFFHNRHNDQHSPKSRRSTRSKTHRTLRFERLDERTLFSANPLMPVVSVLNSGSAPAIPVWIEVNSLQVGATTNATVHQHLGAPAHRRDNLGERRRA